MREHGDRLKRDLRRLYKKKGLDLKYMYVMERGVAGAASSYPDQRRRRPERAAGAVAAWQDPCGSAGQLRTVPQTGKTLLFLVRVWYADFVNIVHTIHGFFLKAGALQSVRFYVFPRYRGL